VVLDEAYREFVSDPDVPDGLTLLAADKDVIVLRTFSKLYGMAGLRAGAAIARPDLLQKLIGYSAGALPVTGMVGAHASLKVKTLVPERRKIIADIRNDVFDWMTKKNYTFIPSVSNKFMLDVKRPGHEYIKAMADQKVLVGRVWPSWPTYVRVSVGTRDEMAKFKIACEKVLG
jgi:histidinol-phosphate aminotransferase